MDNAIKQQTEDGYLSKASYDALIAANADLAGSIELVNGKMQVNVDIAEKIINAP